MSVLVSTIENIIDSVIPWYLSFLEAEASPSVRWVRSTDSFLGVLTGLALSRWNFARIFSMYAGWELDLFLHLVLIYSQSQIEPNWSYVHHRECGGEFYFDSPKHSTSFWSHNLERWVQGLSSLPPTQICCGLCESVLNLALQEEMLRTFCNKGEEIVWGLTRLWALSRPYY